MTETKTVLLTGGTGFLGSNLLMKLVDRGYRLILLARSHSDMTRLKSVLDRIVVHRIGHCSLDDIFANEKIDIIIHCATNYGRNQKDPTDLLEVNLMLPLGLLQLGIKHKVPCFINTDTILDKRVNFYSLSKNQMKEWLKVFSGEITSINVALEHFYGPGDDDSKFVTNVIHRIADNEAEIDLTPGRQKRDFIYIDDVVEAFLCIIEHCGTLGKGFHPFEIGSGDSIEIREFVALVKKLAGNECSHLNFGALDYRKNEVMVSEVDLSAIHRLGWSPRFSLEEGLLITIKREKENRRR
ncbi:NAD(P)-dependent oxidoreductase [Geobacter sp. AOG1]|uniref:NAD-dependent epimerase/dehydratase family protein n=1 Tax=Geobacter sp. AOG1 TaxID=1566346 RepID=UPI001CC39BF2|nr:NAD(P)-dependent oxidoreductase [Geobacter sp. AOG1]GFE58132.1 CDP-paratose synthase [Geobacter sp. AOG1]